MAGHAPAAMTEMPWVKWLDLDTDAEPDGTLVVRLARPKPEHVNHNGDVNAAVAYGVAEIAGAGAVVLGLLDLLDRTYTVVHTGTITYAAPAKGGLAASARLDAGVAAAVRQTVEAGDPADADVTVNLADPAGQPVGECEFRIALRPRR